MVNMIYFQVIYYTFWTYHITSGYVVLAVYTFFLASLLLERSAPDASTQPPKTFLGGIISCLGNQIVICFPIGIGCNTC